MDSEARSHTGSRVGPFLPLFSGRGGDTPDQEPLRKRTRLHTDWESPPPHLPVLGPLPRLRVARPYPTATATLASTAASRDLLPTSTATTGSLRSQVLTKYLQEEDKEEEDDPFSYAGLVQFVSRDFPTQEGTRSVGGDAKSRPTSSVRVLPVKDKIVPSPPRITATTAELVPLLVRSGRLGPGP